MPKRIIVLGIMRSGTSLVAELIRRWGAYAGSPEMLWTSDVHDPRGYGYMEYIPLQKLNNELLDDNDRVPPLDGVLEERASDPAFREKALGLIQDMDDQALKHQADAWIWKDARLPLTLPFWVKYWDDPIYVITVRHPAEVVLSLAKAAGVDQANVPFSAGFAYWQYCMLNALSYTQNSPRKIFITYDKLVNDPEWECARLSRFLDNHCGRPSEDARQRLGAMVSHVSQSQRNHHYQKFLAEMPQATREQRALFNFLRVKVVYPEETFVKDDFAFYPGWREYLESMDALMMLQGAQDM